MVERGRPRRSAARRARERVRFLSEASALLARSIDYEMTLQAVARLAVPFLADWCTVYLRSEGGELTRMAVAVADQELEELSIRLRRYAPTPTSANSRVARVLETGEPDLEPEIPDAYLDSIAQDAEHLEILRRIGFTSSMTVPLAADDRVLGAMSLFVRSRDRRYDDLDLATARELAQRCALAVENARLHRQVQQAVKLRDDFLSAVAHDLKNPLTAAKAYVQMLQRQVTRGEPEQMERRVLQLDATLNKMTKLIDELRDVASLQIGRPLELRREEVELVGLARRAVDATQQLTRGQTIRFESRVASAVGRWDPVRIERVIDNLLGNAVKYTPNGREIEVRVDQTEQEGCGWVVLTVRDQGIGIPVADLPRIFEQFHRGANVTGRIAGTGIGLAGAHQIVEQHGGRLTVESEEGVGSCFGLWLPLEGADRASTG